MASFITWLVPSPILWRHQKIEKSRNLVEIFGMKELWYIKKSANMLNTFLLAFKIWKQNAKTLFGSKVIDIWKKHMILAIFSIFDIIFDLFDDVIKKWEPFWNLFCHHFIYIMSSYKCTKFHAYILFPSEIMGWLFTGPKKPGTARVDIEDMM